MNALESIVIDAARDAVDGMDGADGDTFFLPGTWPLLRFQARWHVKDWPLGMLTRGEFGVGVMGTNYRQLDSGLAVTGWKRLWGRSFVIDYAGEESQREAAARARQVFGDVARDDLFARANADGNQVVKKNADAEWVTMAGEREWELAGDVLVHLGEIERMLSMRVYCSLSGPGTPL